MVVTVLPATSFTSSVHERSAFPFTITVQAPQSPSPQPYFVPVRPRSYRRTHRRMRLGSTSKLTGFPFSLNPMVSFMSTPPGSASSVQRGSLGHETLEVKRDFRAPL